VIGLIVDHPEPMHHYTIREQPWDEPAWRELLDREMNGRLTPTAPVYLYHAPDDEVVPMRVGSSLAEAYRRLGVDVTWVEVPAEHHLAGASAGAPGALDWLADRLTVALR
jgi:hypothetical protein